MKQKGKLLFPVVAAATITETGGERGWGRGFGTNAELSRRG